MKPATLFALVGQLTLATATLQGTSISIEPTTTVHCNATSTLTTTVTLTMPRSSAPAVSSPTTNSTLVVPSSSVPKTSIAASEPVKSTSLPVVSPVSSGISTAWTTLTASAPYPIYNTTVPAIVSSVSGTGVSSTQPPLQVPTNGQGKMTVNGPTMALLVIGGAFLSL